MVWKLFDRLYRKSLLRGEDENCLIFHEFTNISWRKIGNMPLNKDPDSSLCAEREKRPTNHLSNNQRKVDRPNKSGSDSDSTSNSDSDNDYDSSSDSNSLHLRKRAKRSKKSKTHKKKTSKKDSRKKDKKKKSKKKSKRKLSKKHKKKDKRKRKHKTISNSDDTDDSVRYSSITGKKIKLKIDKTRADLVRDAERAAKRRFLNSQF